MSAQLRYKELYISWKEIQQKRDEVKILSKEIRIKQKMLKLLQTEIPTLLDKFNERV